MNNDNDINIINNIKNCDISNYNCSYLHYDNNNNNVNNKHVHVIRIMISGRLLSTESSVRSTGVGTTCGPHVESSSCCWIYRPELTTANRQLPKFLTMVDDTSHWRKKPARHPVVRVQSSMF